MAAILVLGVKVPFVYGGQEVLISSLCRELRARGHEVDLVELPYGIPDKAGLLNQIALWRALDLREFAGKEVDLVIATRFPSYFARHPRKSVWLVHQFREAYDLLCSGFSNFTNDPRDEVLRQIISQGDTRVLAQSAYCAAISRNVAARLKRFNELDADVLYPPLSLGNRYRVGSFQPYVLSVGRLVHIKRVDMMIKAMPFVHHSIKFKIVGAADSPGILEYFNNEIAAHQLWDRVELLGRVSEEQLLELYADAGAVYYAPFNEDYGYVTLEGMASGKPIVTTHDSGGVLEFVVHGENGVVVDADPRAVGQAVNELLLTPGRAQQYGAAGRALVESLGLHERGWNEVIEKLLSPLSVQAARDRSPEPERRHAS